MRAIGYSLLLFSLFACGPADSSAATEDNAAGVSEDSCAAFESGIVSELFGVDASLVSYRRSVPVKSAGHVLCSANWENPDKAELQAEYTKKLQEWSRNMTTGKKEPMPKSPNMDAWVSLTLVATRFDSAAAAVASLEDAVATLSKGVTVSVAGKDYEKKTSFGDWLDNVGDKAVFSDSGELLVADDGKRFAVLVKVAGDPEANHEQAINLARWVIKTY